MRLWSFHPKYLDNVGLSRAINEGISGYKALTKQQKMWQNHSQLTRFKSTNHPTFHFKSYMEYIFLERLNRNCADTQSDIEELKIKLPYMKIMTVTEGQLIYEWNHYIKKLMKRNPKLYKELVTTIIPEAHPIFKVIEGDIESWEKIKNQ